MVVVAVFAAASLFQLGLEALSEFLGMLTANRVTREFGARIFGHQFMIPLSHFRKWSVGETITRIGETGTIRNFLVDTTTGVLLDLLFVAIYLGVLFALSVPIRGAHRSNRNARRTAERRRKNRERHTVVARSRSAVDSRFVAWWCAPEGNDPGWQQKIDCQVPILGGHLQCGLGRICSHAPSGQCGPQGRPCPSCKCHRR